MRTVNDLSKLEKGEHAIVTEVCADGGMNRRLQDLGLVKGTMVTCLQKSPLGDPTAFLIRGAVIALRSEDSSHVRIKYL